MRLAFLPNAAFAVLVLTSPALADATRPGAVALYLQAHGLYSLGQAAKDPLMVLTAARILHGLALTDTKRLPQPAETEPAEAEPAPTHPTPVAPPAAAAMLDSARALDAGLTYSDLIDLVAREVPPQPKVLRVTASTLAPGHSEVWTLDFFGGTYGELAILGDGAGNLNMVVTGADDTLICLDKGSADAAFCGFALEENGYVTVTVTNAGTRADRYLLLTE